MSTETPTIDQILAADTGDSSLVANLAKQGRELEQENTALRIQVVMDSTRFKEMQDAGLRLEVERDELRERLVAAEKERESIRVCFAEASHRDCSAGPEIYALEKERDSLAAQVAAMRGAMLEIWNAQPDYDYDESTGLGAVIETMCCIALPFVNELRAEQSSSTPAPPVVPKEDLISPTKENVSYWTQRIMDAVMIEGGNYSDAEAVIRELLSHDTNVCVKGVPMEVVEKMAEAIRVALRCNQKDREERKECEEALALFEGVKNTKPCGDKSASADGS